MPAEPYTPAELEAGAKALERLDTYAGWPWAELSAAVLRAVLPDHDARVRANERARVAEELGVPLHQAADLDDVTPYRQRIAALEDLLGCYRTGRQPSEKLHRRLEATRTAIARAHAITPTTEEDPDAAAR